MFSVVKSLVVSKRSSFDASKLLSPNIIIELLELIYTELVYLSFEAVLKREIYFITQ
jgi:hypothetical protein